MSFQDDVTRRIVDFLDQIGIPVRIGEVPEDPTHKRSSSTPAICSTRRPTSR